MSDNSEILPDAAVSDDLDLEPEVSTEMESDVVVKTKDVRSRSTRLRASTLTQQIPEYVLNSVDKFQTHLDSCSDLDLATANTVTKYIEALDDSVLEFQSLCTEYDVLIQKNITQVNETIQEMISYYKEEMPAIRKGLVSALNDRDETEEEIAMEAAEEALQAQLLQFREMKRRREAKKLMGAATPSSQTNHGQRETTPTLSQSMTTPTPSQSKTTPSQRETPTHSQQVTTPSHAKRDRNWGNSQHRAIRPEVIDVDDTQSQNSSQSDSGINAMQALADCLMKTMKSTKRSALEPAVFSGDPIEFYEWEMDFDGFVDSEGLSEVEALRFLKKFVDGAARSCIAGQLITNSREAYASARQQLRNRYGNTFNVARALRLKLDGWPKVQPSMGIQLREFSDYLNHLKMAMATITELHILNDSLENEKMVSKLPDYLISKWAEVIMNKRVQEQRYPSFHEFASFIHHQSEVLNEPIMALRHSRTEKTTGQSAKDTQTHTRVLSTKTTTGMNSTCLYCNKGDQHTITSCWSFKKLTSTERIQYAKSKRLCFGCAMTGHMSKDCPNRSECEECGMSHPTILHNPNWKKSSSVKSEVTATPNQSEARTPVETKAPVVKTSDVPEVSKQRSYKTRVSTQGLNMVLPVYVSSESDPANEILVYAILDTASCSSYISNDVALQLQTKCVNEDIEMDTLNGITCHNVDNHLNLKVRGYKSEEVIGLEAYGVDNISAEKEEIPTTVNVARFEHLRDVAQQIPPLMNVPVGILIGRNCSDVFVPYDYVKGKKGEPFAQKSILGWTVMAGGKKGPGRSVNQVRVNSSILSYSHPLDDEETISQDDIKFMNIMNSETRQCEDGSLEMPLPFKIRPVVPDNHQQAYKRLLSLQTRFDRDAVFKGKYTEFMKDLIDNGHAEEVGVVPEKPGEIWYVPHFAVKHPKKDKVRVVFDCSAQYKGSSINDHLLQGPDLLNSLIGILCRFRKEPVAIACDIEKMYYNFYVAEEDRDFLRFLWPDSDGKVRRYRMTVHLFGATSSPAVATYGLRLLAEKHKDIYPTAADFVKKDFYVDDGVTSVKDLDEAKKLIQDSRELCAKGNLRLHKFVSNNKELLAQIPDSEKTDTQSLFDGNLPTHRTLGLEWSVAKDMLTFTTNLQLKSPTRRGILSTVAQMYDPLGLISPYTLLGKNILQKVNNTGLEWDDLIPKHLEDEWSAWMSELPKLEKLTIPRCVKPVNFGKVMKTELHHFADASLSGIGACSYIKMTNENEEIHSELLMAKSRVVPSKGKVTIPRLELQAALMATQLSRVLNRELNLEVDEEHYWSDSKIVLGYLANDSKRFHTYVANRIQEIKSKTDAAAWHHIPGDINPADIASRGLVCSKLATSMWFKGPDFLRSKEEVFSQGESISSMLDNTDPEVKSVKITQSTTADINPIHRLTEHYSDWARLRRAVAHLKSFANGKSWKPQQIDANNIRKAETLIIQQTQSEHFSEELSALKKDGKVNRGSSIVKLNPFIDHEGVLRVGGRIRKSAVLTDAEKHPVIVPKSSRLASLITADIHERTHHQGRAYTLSAIREAGYWIISGPHQVKSLIDRCTTCRWLRGKAVTQQLGELPAERIGNTPPFTCTGMDCFGPFVVKERRTELKKYGLVFTCMYSRAIHIELLDDMSTDAFLNALRCFISLRGHVEVLYSDNGTNFVGAKNELNKQFIEMLDGDCKHYLANKQIEFKTITPTASHQGGVWERQIRTIRAVLNEILLKHKARLDTSMLRTTFYEVMATVNSRPLSLQDINNPEDIILTPNMLLNGKKHVTPPPPGCFPEASMYGRSRWKKVQVVAEDFWRKWKSSYLDSITQRQTWKDKADNLKVDDVVLVMDQDQPRNDWKRGIVTETHPGEDGLVRKATVRLGNRFLDRKGKVMEKATVLIRPVQKLVKLM